jgi:hypothetical protein
MNTMIVVIMVSRRVGHVTLETSDRTCRVNSTGEVFFFLVTSFATAGSRPYRLYPVSVTIAA